ncbi:MAG: hypothetical protein K6U74_11255 [Firmicutes bacterium]|nr:hypothetical protein [Bacillota bacterium]
MAFKLINDLNGSPAVIRKYLVTNSEAIKRGEALKLASGRLTKAGATDAVAAIATHDVAAGTDKECEVIVVTGSQVYEVEYTGTPAAGFLVGANDCDLDSTGLKVDAASVAAGGGIAILKIDTEKTKCHAMFKNRQLN